MWAVIKLNNNNIELFKSDLKKKNWSRLRTLFTQIVCSKI